MRWLLFLSRVAFICGVFFLIAVSLLMTNWISDETIVSTVVIIGYLMGAILLFATNLCYLGVLVVKKKLKKNLGDIVPLWLVTANLLFLVFIIYFIFYLNDPYYHQK
jgi:drug/metabolite transporter (DMT)-like permease